MPTRYQSPCQKEQYKPKKVKLFFIVFHFDRIRSLSKHEEKILTAESAKESKNAASFAVKLSIVVQSVFN
jgi:hypothetical protein